MDRPLDQQLVSHLRSLDVEKTFISYLRGIKQYNDSLSSQALSQKELQRLSLPISLSQSNLLGIYDSLKKVQKAVKENPETTIDDLFSLLFPIVHRAYKKLIEDEKENPIQIQNAIFNPSTPPNIEGLLGMSAEEVEESLRNLPGMPSNDPPLTISDLLPAFIDSVFPDLNAKEQYELLSHTYALFEDFEKSSFNGIKLSDLQLAELVERKKIDKLFLEDVEEITPAGLISLINDFPHLKIILGRNTHFDVNDFGDLIRRAQKMQRPLYCQIRGKEYSLFQKDLREVIEPAIEYGHLALAEALINHFPINLSVTDKHGNTFLHQMAKRGTPDSVRFLIEKCPFPLTIPNHLAQTAFHLAAQEGNVKTLETLIHLEKDPRRALSLKDKNGSTPFHCATLRDQSTTAALLLHEIITHRLPAGEEVHLEPDTDGNTLLHMAAKFGMIDAIPSLIQRHGINVNVKGRYGRTPLHMATHNGQVEATRKLIEQGADVNARSDEEDGLTTPLHEAAFRGQTAVVELLLQSQGLDINLQNKRQFTAASIAVMNGNLPIARMLITHPHFEGGEDTIDRYIEEAKKFRHWHLLPLLHAERSLLSLNTMRPQDRDLEAERIIDRFRSIAPPQPVAPKSEMGLWVLGKL